MSAADLPPPVFPGEKWETATPEAMGVDGDKLKQAIAYFESESGKDGVSEMVVVRRGRVIWRGDRADQVHLVWSCTKSFGSLVTGLLFDDGKVTPDTRIADVLPAYRELYPELKVHHMLSLTSGTANEDRQNLDNVKEPIYPPGSHFHYAPGLNILSRALTQLAGEELIALFHRRIAEPIGMKNYRWETIGEEKGRALPGFGGSPGQGVFTSADEMARLGLLLLSEGRWGDKQLLSKEWLQLATRPQAGVDTPLWEKEAWYRDIHGAYGYLFWVNGVRPDGQRLWPAAPDKTFAIQGNRNNICWILPDWEMVVVRLGTDKVVANEVNRRFLELLGAALKSPAP